MKTMRVGKQAQHNALVALCCILLIHFFFGRAIWQRMLLPEAACDYENDCKSSCKSRSIYCAHLILVTVRKVYITLAILFSFLALCVSSSRENCVLFLYGTYVCKSFYVLLQISRVPGPILYP